VNFAILTIIGMVAVIVLWAAARLLRAARIRRGGLDVSAEERRLRHDPRFTQAWVDDVKKDTPRRPDDPSAT
jgi:hypothetical protein